MDRILVVLDDANAGNEAVRIVRAATGAPLATIVARIRAGAPVIDARLLGNDHDAQAARLVGALDALAAAGFATTLHEVDDGVPFDAMPLPWRAQCRLPRSVLDNRLAARETERHRITMLAEIERFAPEDPSAETVPLQAMLPDGRVVPLRVEVATQPPWRLRLLAEASEGSDATDASGAGDALEAPRAPDAADRLRALLPLDAEGEDLVEALARARAAIEPLGVRLLCQGARRDVHPSPMSRQAGGRLAYVIVPGRPARRDDLVDVLAPLAPADRALAATLAEQAEQARRWAASITALPG